MKKQITIPGFIYAAVPEDWRYGMADVIDGVHYSITPHKCLNKTPIATINLTFDAPDHADVTAGFVAELKEQKTKLMAEHQNAITQLDRKIQELLAISCEVTV